MRSIAKSLCALILFSVGSTAIDAHEQALSDGRSNMTSILSEIVDWVMTTDVGSNRLNNKTYFSVNNSIFVNGNLARVLLAAYKLTGNESYLEEGIRWCNSFADLQQPIVTSTGENGGYWDTGYNRLYFGDAGTATTALAVCHSLASTTKQKETYESALRRFAAFVTRGCQHAPLKYVANDTCPPLGHGWVIDSTQRDGGALGDGYYLKAINLEAYTISTATMAAAFAEMKDMNILSSTEGTIALNAVDWILSTVRPDGTVPYIISPPDTTSVLYQPITYSAEAFIDVDMRYGSMPQVHERLATSLNATVRFLVANQSADGSWGVWRSSALAFSPLGDAQRSPRAFSLLQWYYQHVEADPDVGMAIRKYIGFLSDAENRAAFGLGGSSDDPLALPTGFVGLAVADYLQPWVTFRPMLAQTFV